MVDEAMRLAERLVTWCPMPMCDTCLVAGALIALRPLVEAAEAWSVASSGNDADIAESVLLAAVRSLRGAR